MALTLAYFQGAAGRAARGPIKFGRFRVVGQLVRDMEAFLCSQPVCFARAAGGLSIATHASGSSGDML